MWPYRCTACSHRFIVPAISESRPARSGFPGWAVVMGIVVVLAIVGLQKGWYPLDRASPETDESPKPWSVASLLPNDSPIDAESNAALIRELRQSAESGDTEAMTRLGLMHKRGFGVLQDFGLAATWLRKAADAGNPDAMLELGRLYRDGVGFEQDMILAYVWFNRSAAALNTNAVLERHNLAQRMTPEQVKSAQELSAAP